MFQKISNMLLTKNGIIFVIAVALFLIFVAEIKTRRKKYRPYRMQNCLLTMDEYAFYSVLVYALPPQKYIVCPKVRLADVIYVTGKKKNGYWFHNYAQIAQKHIDFVVCNRTGQILFGLELDGKSHYARQEKTRDAQKNEICRAAGFPLLRVRSSKTYDSGSVREFIQNTLNIRL